MQVLLRVRYVASGLRLHERDPPSLLTAPRTFTQHRSHKPICKPVIDCRTAPPPQPAQTSYRAAGSHIAVRTAKALFARLMRLPQPRSAFMCRIPPICHHHKSCPRAMRGYERSVQAQDSAHGPRQHANARRITSLNDRNHFALASNPKPSTPFYSLL